MENNAVIKCTNVIDDSICTVIILKYKVYRNDSGKLFGRLLVLKHKVENFLKEVLDEDILFQNPLLQRTKDGLLDLFQGLTSLCSGVSHSREMLMIPDLPSNSGDMKSSYEMKFIKGPSPKEMWLCYVNNVEFLNLLKRLSEKFDNDELEPFIFFPRIGEHVYFKQGSNIFRGIVQEYVIADNCEDEERVDVKVLNIDNSDVIVLSQNCFFQLDKDGTELPMQCVLCSLDETDKGSIGDGTGNPDLSLNMLKKHKLNVSFRQKKLNIKDSPIAAQCVSIALSADKLKDKKNGFNVNSKEFVPRNSISNDVQPSTSISDSDNKSDQTTRSSSPGSSQDETVEKPSQNTTSSPIPVKDKIKSGDQSTTSSKDTKNININEKEKIENKVIVSNYPNKNYDSSASNMNVGNTFRSHDKDRNLYNKDYRCNSSKMIDNKNKSMSTVNDKMRNTGISSPNENRNKSGPPSTSSHPSQTQSPANLPPNPQVPPYLFQSVPQFQPAPIHFSGQYVPIPAPQQLNSSMPFHFPQYPYAPAYLPSGPPPPTAHSQAYHMPPVTSPYQPYMQPVAVGPFFSSQPPLSQQFYQPSHLQPSWSHLQPSFHISGSSQQPTGGGKVDVSNASGVSKFK